MFKSLKHTLMFVVLLCPEGVAIALVCSLMELVYRLSVYFGFSNSSLNFLSLFFGFSVFIILFMYRLFLYFIKKRKKDIGGKTL
jgi:hypothetical protein